MTAIPESPAETAPSPPVRGVVVAIVGPTAVGKSIVADVVASALGGEIVSADSMQVYRGMDIGTAKTPVLDRMVPHHCIDLVDPGESFSAELYQRCARAAIDRIAAGGEIPVLVGGTGLYMRAALDDWRFPAGEQASERRTEYEAYAERSGAEALHALLEERDPASAALIHPNNMRRVVRALEMLDEGQSYAEQHSGFSRRESLYPAVFIGLDMERKALYRRIDSRVDQMIAAGFLGEVRGLLAAGFREGLTSTQAIGYKELVPVVEEGAELEAAVESIKQASRRYAKRQLTWFRADPRISWIDATGLTSKDTAARVLGVARSELTSLGKLSAS